MLGDVYRPLSLNQAPLMFTARRTAELIKYAANAKPAVAAKRKSRPKAALNSNLMIEDQAAINAGFDFRRYAMTPMPAKPRIIIAHVEGSGTAAVSVSVPTSPGL